jgi:hypothetical protein
MYVGLFRLRWLVCGVWNEKGGMSWRKKRVSENWCVCAKCKRRFHPSVYHPEQTYCFRSGCRKESERVARKKCREYRVGNDGGFLAREAARVADCRKRRGKTVKARAVEDAQYAALWDVMVGLVVHLHGDQEGMDSTQALLRRLRVLGRERWEDPAEFSEGFLLCTGSGFEQGIGDSGSCTGSGFEAESGGVRDLVCGSLAGMA